MKRMKLTVAYDGTNYCGWQMQPNGITVQQVLEEELSRLLKEKVTIMGASRTDSGVHALGNVAVFDTNTRIPGDKISFALNQGLPDDIRIQESDEVAQDFHPRYCESKKTYEYKILNKRIPVPTLRHYAHFTYTPLDVEKMKQGAAYFIGEHDFKSFCGAGAQVKTTVRTIWNLTVTKEEELICISITGSGFLYNMVRIIAGTLMEVGKGTIPPDKIAQIIEACDRNEAGPTAPAKGLTLVGIEYS